jgi:hypothetical protein
LLDDSALHDSVLRDSALRDVALRDFALNCWISGWFWLVLVGFCHMLPLYFFNLSKLCLGFAHVAVLVRFFLAQRPVPTPHRPRFELEANYILSSRHGKVHPPCHEVRAAHATWWFSVRICI